MSGRELLYRAVPPLPLCPLLTCVPVPQAMPLPGRRVKYPLPLSLDCRTRVAIPALTFSVVGVVSVGVAADKDGQAIVQNSRRAAEINVFTCKVPNSRFWRVAGDC